MDKLNIIGVNGQLGSGKDTVADCFVDEGYVKVALADPMKRFCRDIFGFTEKQLFGPSDYRNDLDKRYSVDASGPHNRSRGWDEAEKNIKDLGLVWIRELMPTAEPAALVPVLDSLLHWFSELRLKHAQLSPRIALQKLGTEWGRQALYKDVWIDYNHRTVKKLLQYDGRLDVHYDYTSFNGLVVVEASPNYLGVVIPDVRFENELEFILEHKGKTIKVVLPDTYDMAADTGVSSHASEMEQQGFDINLFSAIISNDGTLDKLKEDMSILAGAYADQD